MPYFCSPMYATNSLLRRGFAHPASTHSGALHGCDFAAGTFTARHVSTPSPPPQSSSTSPAEVVPTTEAPPTPCSSPVHSSFRSATNFKLSPAQVNESNVPSAKEVGRMIPTLHELRSQLPDARVLEQRYIHAGTDSTAGSSQLPTASIFQQTTDPVEDLLFGPPQEGGAPRAATAESQPPRRQHLLLAYSALLWGTVYAVVGFAATVAAAMYVCGYGSLAALMDGVRGKMRRDEDRLRASIGCDDATTVEHYVVDLTHPTEAWRQLQEALSAVQRLAEEEDAETRRKPPF